MASIGEVPTKAKFTNKLKEASDFRRERSTVISKEIEAMISAAIWVSDFSFEIVTRMEGGVGFSDVNWGGISDFSFEITTRMGAEDKVLKS